jgi:hypothetical protein
MGKLEGLNKNSGHSHKKLFLLTKMFRFQVSISLLMLLIR